MNPPELTGSPDLHEPPHTATRSEDKARNDRALRIARDGLARGMDADTGYQAAPIYRDALQDIIRTLSGDPS